MSSSKIRSDRFVARMCQESYYQFFLEFWSTIAAERFVDSWYIKQLCDELQTIAERVFLDKPKEYDLVWNCPPGTSKPVWEGSFIWMGDGSWKLLREIQVGDEVLGKSGKPCLVSAVHIQGKLPCVQITTAAGRQVVAAVDHPFLTADGWVKAGDLSLGQSLALLHQPEIKSSDQRSLEEFILAGYLIGDGSLTGGSCSLTSVDPDYIRDFCSCVRRLGFGYLVRTKKNESTSVVLTRISLSRKSNSVNSPREWLREVGLAGKSSYTKCVPDFVWQGSDEQIAAFLAAYFHCDGYVSTRSENKRNITVAMTTVSEELARGLQRLFLRLGVPMRFRKHVNKNGFAYNRDLAGYTTYRVETTDQDAAVRFLEKIPLQGRKKAKLEDFRPQRRTFQQTYWPDPIKQIETLPSDMPCRCLTVEGDESFCVEGLVVHNSSNVSILWQPWIWTRMPSARFISGSYSERLALDLSRKSRDIVTSEKYRALFPFIKLRDDQNTKSYFVNTEGGMRYAVGVGGTVIGMHAHFIAIDDPLDPQAAMSDLMIAEANVWMMETLSRRKVNVMLTPTVLIMQRLHQDDPSGNLLSRGTAVKHCCLPADDGSLVKPEEFREFYSKNDGLLDPIRLSRKALEDALAILGEVGYAGQYSQNPVPRGGALFKVDRLQYSPTPPTQWRRFPRRYWDKAATAAGGAWTAGVKIGLDMDNRVWILDVVRGQWDSAVREKQILATARLDGRKVQICVEQEPGGSGKDSAEDSAKMLTLAGFHCKLDKVTGDKELRADPLSVQVNSGNVVLLNNAAWNATLVEEMRYFPRSKYKDQIDAASGCFNQLAKTRLRIGVL